MFNWLTPKKTTEQRLTSRTPLRTITTERGTRFDVFAETAHFVMCHEPEDNADTPRDALLDFEDMAVNGYWLCHIYHGPGAFVVFEKREQHNEEVRGPEAALSPEAPSRLPG